MRRLLNMIVSTYISGILLPTCRFIAYLSGFFFSSLLNSLTKTYMSDHKGYFEMFNKLKTI